MVGEGVEVRRNWAETCRREAAQLAAICLIEDVVCDDMHGDKSLVEHWLIAMIGTSFVICWDRLIGPLNPGRARQSLQTPCPIDVWHSSEGP
jgi:hypothetical protein